MKILHVVPSLALRHGGVSVSVRELCAGLAQNGVSVTIYTTWRGYNEKTDAPLDQQLRALGVSIEYFPVHRWNWLGQRYSFSPALKKTLENTLPSFDLVHIHSVWLYPTLIASRLCRRFKIPYLLSPCGALDPYGMRQRGLLKKLYGFFIERFSLIHAGRIHFTSPLEASRAFRFGTKTPHAVIPCSIGYETIPKTTPGDFRKNHPEIGNRSILLFLGRMHLKKRPDLLAYMLEKIPCKENLHLVFVGPDEGAAKSVKTALKRTGLLDHATFVPTLSGGEKWACYRDSHLFLLPSRDENFGITVLEAMAAGLPVMISPEVGIAAWVARNRCGKVEPVNSKQWADALISMLENPSELNSMGKAGQQLAKTVFSTTEVSKQIRDLYQDILRESST